MLTFQTKKYDLDHFLILAKKYVWAHLTYRVATAYGKNLPAGE